MAAKARLRLDGADPINDNLALFWPLLGSGGQIATDISPHRRLARLYSGAAYTTNGVAVASNAYIESAYFSGVDFSGGKWFISFWVTGAYASQVTYGNLFTINGSGLYREASTDRLALYLSGVTNYDFGAGTYSEIFTGTRNHVAVTQNGTTATLYLNGRLRSTIAVAGAPTNPSGVIHVGTDLTNAYPTTGAYQNIRAAPRVLLPNEAMRLYRDPWAGTARPVRRVAYVPIAPITAEGAITFADMTIAGEATYTAPSAGGVHGVVRRRVRRQLWNDVPVELKPVVALAENYADELAVQRAVDDALARFAALKAKTSIARRERLVGDLKRAIVAAVEEAAETDDEDALIALL